MSAVDASRFSVTCAYPELADRRRLAARRESVRGEQTRPFSDAAPVTPESTELNVAVVRSPSVTPRIHSVGHVDIEPPRIELAVPGSAGINLDDLPPRAIGLALLDIYFERLYNATLLFNRTQLFESYLDGSLPPYLLRSIFALSSLFLRKPRYQSPRLGSHAVSTELAAFATYASYGDAWAESARREVWLLTDRPTVQVVQALSCLNLYWFATRDLDRARINAVMAYASATTFRSINVSDNETRTKNGLQLIERKHGCFWACWATMSISSFPEAYAKNAWEEACNVALPIASDGFASDANVGHHYHMTVEWKPEGLSDELNPPSSIMAEHMRLMGVWLAKDIYDSSQFPPYTTGNESTGNIARLLGLHSLYHLCQIVLLCPLVSLFSGRRGIAGATTQTHAETIIKHAIHHGHLIRDYLTRRQDVSKLSSHVGFASFVSTSIILTLLRSRARRHHADGNTRDHVSHALVTLIQDSIDILSILQTFWEHLEPMTSSLQRAADLVLGPFDRDRHSITGAESRPIEIPMTGVNSPAREEDVIATTYIESPEYPNGQHSASSYANSHFGVTDRAVEHITHSVVETADWHHHNLFEWCQTEGLLDIGDDFVDIGNSVDWKMDLDLLTGFSSQMA
ncbi:fungal transcriptional regulatory [Fusarium tjaetaba]|uniref:Fungal transcriptional regulatory n=1 Tax=Fusarium tjaetaba TaxID=1567544 RepID=A0A8H5RAQ4_9HYPO|nr:fungal transcriptional regulatory [Fusarium tjaetaba]KAF5629787.1 fungal transcriptional regulatory [Fusarium tjaetaba]